MGMAASQARYLALAARKSNCEYEGQQINQARLNLANQSAKLFNQMLGLSVPTPPSTQDFTTTQYSFTDGINPAVIDKWEQLATPDEEGNNYVVEYHYEAYVYKGFQKKMNDPQVQFANAIPTSIDPNDIHDIYEKQSELKEAQRLYNKALSDLATIKASAASRSTYVNNVTSFNGYDINGGSYSEGVYTLTGPDVQFTEYSALSPQDKTLIDTYYQKMQRLGLNIDKNDICLASGQDVPNADTIALKQDLNSLIHNLTSVLPIYFMDNVPDGYEGESVDYMDGRLAAAEQDVQDAKDNLTQKQLAFDNVNKPSFVGNCKLTSLGELEEQQKAEIKQIMATMKENGVTSYLSSCYNVETDEYTGGIYSFEQNGVTYYTTYYDLCDSIMNGNGPNNIDNQPKLNYYHANYVKDNIEKIEKAVLETDSRGRFSSVRFSSDGATYTLNFEQKTDDAAYQDAMNQYYYKNAEYDKMIQDINAKTSIIQQEDVQLELRLKQLDTEQNALKNEIDAVQSVIKDNVEKSFKTFGG